MNQTTKIMKKLIILALAIPGLIFAQADVAKSLDSQFRSEIIKLRKENGISVVSDPALDSLAKSRVLAVKKMFQQNWGKGIPSNLHPDNVRIGDKYWPYCYLHGVVLDSLPKGFVINRQDPAILPFKIFEKKVRGEIPYYGSLSEILSFPMCINKKELDQMRKNLVIPRYNSLIECYKRSLPHYKECTGESMKEYENRKYGSYTEIFEVEPGKYFIFHVALFVGV